MLKPELGGLRSSVPGGKWKWQVQQEQLEQGSHDRSITPAFHLLSTEFRPRSFPKQNAGLSYMRPTARTENVHISVALTHSLQRIPIPRLLNTVRKLVLVGIFVPSFLCLVEV